MTSTRIVIDAQVHLWEEPPAGAEHHRVEPFRLADLLTAMDSASVDGALVVTPITEGDDNSVALAAARAAPTRIAAMGRISLTPPAPARVRTWRDQDGMLGIRVTFSRPDDRGQLTDGTADWLWQAASAAEVPIMVYPPGQLAALETVAAAHPGLRLIVDHLGLPGSVVPDDIADHIAQLLVLAKYPNVATKLSGVLSHATDEYPYRSLHRHLEAVIAAFGPERVFWATDVTRLPCSYRAAKELFTRELGFLTQSDIDWIMGRGIAEWVGWTPAHVDRNGGTP